MLSTCSQIFISHLPQAERSCFANDTEWSAMLEEQWREVQRQWPGFGYSLEEFVPHWASCLVGLEAPHDAFQTLHVAELYLAFACGQRNESAVEAFHRLYLGKLRSVLRRMRLDDALIDDLIQMLLFRVLVGSDESKAKILLYGGRGSLAGWLRVIAVREARASLQKQARELPVSDVEGFAAKSAGGYSAILELAGDPEYAYIKHHFRSELKAIFPIALRTLEIRDRNLLRLEMLNGLHHQQIAKIYNVHRTTVLRWLHAAESKLSEEIRRLVKAKLKLGDTELESLLRLVRSQLSLSIAGAFLAEGEEVSLQ